jgi:sigma-E factor negative regulatory protein RseA
MNASQLNSKPAAVVAVSATRRAEVLSALSDGEASSADFDALLAHPVADDDARSDWRCYQVIGEVLRATARPVSGRSPTVFVAEIRRQLDLEAVPSPFVQKPEQVRPGGEAAANDGLFRWKLVAGLASVVAVAAVTWGLSGLATVTDGSGVQLASGQAPAPNLPGPVEAQPMMVDTAQGLVIRDAHLEELLAEHRQYGGASALQMPAGFLRNATFDTVPQR